MTISGGEQPLGLPLTDRSENADEWFNVPPWWEQEMENSFTV